MIDPLLLADAADALRARAAALATVRFLSPFSRSFSFQDINTGVTKQEIEGWLKPDLGTNLKKPVIYRISACSDAATQNLLPCFDAYRATKDHNVPRKNGITGGRTLYVGTSKSIATRLTQHLFCGPKDTYALHLHKWCPAAPFSITVDVQAPDQPIPQDLLQDAEDALWDRCQPVFGRRGAR